MLNFAPFFRKMSHVNIQQITRYAYTNSIKHALSLRTQEQDKSSVVEQHPPFGDRKYRNTLSQKRGVEQDQREHHII